MTLNLKENVRITKTSTKKSLQTNIIINMIIVNST